MGAGGWEGGEGGGGVSLRRVGSWKLEAGWDEWTDCGVCVCVCVCVCVVEPGAVNDIEGRL